MPLWKSALSSQMCANAMFIEIYESHWSEKTCIWRRGLFTIPWTKFPVPVWNFNDSEPLLLQVLTIHLCGGKISVKFTSSDNIANNFAWWILFLNWNAVCQVKQNSILLLESTAEGPNLWSPTTYSLTPKRGSLKD